MNSRIARTIIVLILVSTLVTFDFIFLGHSIANAVSEELENQLSTTSVKNVEFDAYFRDGENKIHEKQVQIANEESIILNINVEEQGAFNEGKISFENSNFKIQASKINNTYVKSVTDTEIELNSIIYGNNIEIEIPIKFNKQENFEEGYFTKEISVNLSGKYKDEQEKEVTGNKNIKINWVQDTHITLSQNIEKYIKLSDETILLQQNVITQVQDNNLPRENEQILIQVPLMEGQKPNSVSVILNGEKLTEDKAIYNKETGSLEIYKDKEINAENKIIWGSGNNIYKIVYIYDKEVGDINRAVELKTTTKTKLYTADIIENQDIQTVDISKMGNVASLEQTMYGEIYKGYMYENSENEISFTETNTIEVSQALSIQNIKLEQIGHEFVDVNENVYAANGNVIYKSTVISKSDFDRIFGQEGQIILRNGENVIITINKDSVADENGDIVVNYEGEVTNPIIETNNPQTEGNISIRSTKVIKGNTSYSKEQLKTFTKLKSKTKISSNIGEEIAESSILLNDTKTEAKLEISNTKLSTLQTNENVQFLVTLLSDSEKYDLYKNPIVEIVLPKEISVNVKNITQLNGQEELSISNPRLYKNAEGQQVIHIEMQGEQKVFQNNINQGIQISITADISSDKATPTKVENIVMNYTNENRQGENFNLNVPINLNSKSGVLVVNRLSEFNNNGDVIENIDDKDKEVILDTQVESKIINQNISIVNNYETPITDISIIGKIPTIEATKDNEGILKSTFEMSLAQSINATGKVVKISYSEDENASINSDSWTLEDFTKAKAFKIELEDNKINPQEVLNISYGLQIPEMLEYNESSYTSISLYYNYLGDVVDYSSKIVLKTESDTSSKQSLLRYSTGEHVNGLDINILAKSGENYLTEDDIVLEGQGIRYIITLKNDTEEEMTNIVLNAKNTNAIYYNLIEYEEEVNDYMCTKYKFVEDETLTSKTINIESIKPGEEKEVSYQITVKKVPDENQVLGGEIELQADNYEKQVIQNLTNKIGKGDLKLNLDFGFSEDTKMYSTEGFPIKMNIKNTSTEVLNDIIVELPVADEFTFEIGRLIVEDDSRYELIEYTTNNVKLRIPEINPDEQIEIVTLLIMNKMPIDITEDEVVQFFTATHGNTQYFSNDIVKTIYQSETNIVANQTTNINGDTVKDGENIEFSIEIENKGKIEKDLTFMDDIQSGLNINSAKIIKDGSESNIETFYDLITYSLLINPNEKVKIVINTTVDVDSITENTISNYANISGNRVNLNTNVIEFKIEGREEQGTGDDEQNSTYSSISGTAWIDSNANGVKEESEPKLPNVPVILLDDETGKMATDINGNELFTVTDSTGSYSFDLLQSNKYIVAFRCDSNKYAVTGYQKEGVSENSNSDVLYSTISLYNQEQIEVAKTKTLILNNNKLENIDAGFVENKEFDLSLNKYVNKIIIQNNNGTRIVSYTKEKIAKVEIDAKYLSNSNVIIEYGIDVTNEGEVAGYADELIDYIPKDLSFSSEMNKSWYQNTEGNLCTKELSNQIINPGETKTVILTLTKRMTQNNVGTIINQAETNMQSNDYMTGDIDSTPGNKKDNEDDISRADVIISVRTGGVVIYFTLIITIIAIVATGVYFIRKEVLKESF